MQECGHHIITAQPLPAFVAGCLPPPAAKGFVAAAAASCLLISLKSNPKIQKLRARKVATLCAGPAFAGLLSLPILRVCDQCSDVSAA